jgi:hypothetical protein
VLLRAALAIHNPSGELRRLPDDHTLFLSDFGVLMSSTRSLLLLSGSLLLLSGLLTGCATETHMPQHHEGGAMTHGHDAMMDMRSMCDMHKQMMSGKTAAEQQAIMDEHAKSMTPEMRQRMRSMMEQCK